MNEKQVRPGLKRYQSGLRAVEGRLSRELRGLYGELRKNGIEAVKTHGVGTVARERIREEFRVLKTEASALVGEHIIEIDDRAHDFNDVQINSFRRSGIPTPSRTPRASVNVPPDMFVDWIDNAQSNVMGTMNRVALTDDPDALDLLFSAGLLNGRASAYRKGLNSLNTSVGVGVYTLGNSILNILYDLMSSSPELIYARQVIATIDELTTETCLRTHGQVKGINQPFEIRGTPRFSDQIMSPPFHWYCRTSVSLYHPTMEELLGFVDTETLVKMANAELIARGLTGTRVEIHPSHATSGR